ncbi:FeoB-associated Cys-rich membrane protein [Aliarcobacter butzleri]|nr:FeoB-associated Cys-rich membrane protein [Aliarcobacter butzleri]
MENILIGAVMLVIAYGYIFFRTVRSKRNEQE